MDERLLKTAECQRLLGLSRSTVMALIASGEIPSLTIGRSRRVALSSLTRWLAEREAANRLETDLSPGVHEPEEEALE